VYIIKEHPQYGCGRGLSGRKQRWPTRICALIWNCEPVM